MVENLLLSELMRLNEVDDLEVMSGWDNRKIYELGVYEAIERVSLKSYTKDELFHLSYKVSAAISDDISNIRRKTELSESKICRGIVAHGASIIQHNYDKIARDFDMFAGKLNNIKEMPYIRRLASNVSVTTFDHSTEYNIKKNTRLVDWAVIYLGEFGGKIFVRKDEMIKSAFCFSLCTMDNSLNIDLYEKEIKNFDDYMTNKLFIFESVYKRYEEEVENPKQKLGS